MQKNCSLFSTANHVTRPVIIFLMCWWVSLAWGQNELPGYPQDARRLIALSRDLWSQVELQMLNYSVPDRSQISSQEDTLRRACLFLEAAVALDTDNAQAHRDLMTLYTSTAINDPGRARESLIRYSEMRPSEDEPVANWISYRLDNFDDLRTRQYFLEQTLANLRDYPLILSQAMTQLGIYALERSDTEKAYQYFRQAVNISPDNTDALARMLELTLPSEPSDAEEISAEISAQRQQERQYHQIQSIYLWRLRIHHNPYDLTATLNLIDALENQGSYHASHPYYRHAYNLMRLDNVNRTFINNLRIREFGNRYLLRQFDTCNQIAEKAIEQAPEDILFYFLQAHALENMGQADQADQIRRRATVLAQDPNLPAEISQQIDEKLGNIEADPNSALRDNIKQVRELLTSDFNERELGLPQSPQDFVKCYLRLPKDIYNYGESITGKIYLTNIGHSNIKLGPDGFLDPHILITAEVSNKVYPISYRYLNQKAILRPGRSNTIDDIFDVGPLKKNLDDHPQQNYKITFHVYLDPVINEEGVLAGRIAELQPQAITITRKAFIPGKSRMKLQLQGLKNKSVTIRVKSAAILGGLLREEQRSRQGEIAYRRHKISAQTIQPLLIANLEDPDFRVRAWTAYALRDLSQMRRSLADKLNDSHWFVRFMTVMALESQADLEDYGQWAATEEKKSVLQRQGLRLQGKPWEIINIPITIPPDSERESETSKDAPKPIQPENKP